MAASEKLAQANEPLPQPSLLVATQIAYFSSLWGLKVGTALGFGITRLFWPAPAELRPTIVRAYPCRPRLRNRIFIPNCYTAGELLPLYLDVHGGGFALCDAQFDDHFCSTLANKLDVLVVSIEYGVAPLNKFPGPSNDIAAVAKAIIEDEILPVDRSRVVLGGFSAGGNLCLSAAQMSGLKDKIRGVVAWYPFTDLTLTPAEKQASRLYRNAKDVDDLKDWGPVWDWGYIRSGQDIRDPQLSVKFARKEDLPDWIVLLG